MYRCPTSAAPLHCPPSKHISGDQAALVHLHPEAWQGNMLNFQQCVLWNVWIYIYIYIYIICYMWYVQHCQYMCIQMLYAVYVYHMNIMFWLCTVKSSRCLFTATCFPASERIWGSDSCTSSDYWWWWRSSDEHLYVPIQRQGAAVLMLMSWHSLRPQKLEYMKRRNQIHWVYHSHPVCRLRDIVWNHLSTVLHTSQGHVIDAQCSLTMNNC